MLGEQACHSGLKPGSTPGLGPGAPGPEPEPGPGPGKPGPQARARARAWGAQALGGQGRASKPKNVFCIACYAKRWQTYFFVYFGTSKEDKHILV